MTIVTWALARFGSPQDAESSVPALFPEPRTVSERFYGMVSYRVTSWFSPGLTTRSTSRTSSIRDGRERVQHDFAATVRYDLTQNWLVKLEGHVLHGTAALKKDLNGGREINTLTANWGLLVFKTTAYF